MAAHAEHSKKNWQASVGIVCLEECPHSGQVMVDCRSMMKLLRANQSGSYNLELLQLQGKSLMPTSKERYSIGHLSRRTQVRVDTIRYYERVGVLPTPPRTLGGQRIYDDGHRKLLGFVKHGRQLGFSLGELRGLLDAGGPGVVTCAETKRIATAHLRRVRSKIETLKSLECVLAGAVEQCSGEPVRTCAVIGLLTSSSEDGFQCE